jgi:hypothetical protein
LESAQKRLGTILGFGGRLMVGVAERQSDVLLSGQMGEEIALLKDESQPPSVLAESGFVRGKRGTIDLDRTFVGNFQSSEKAEKGRLSPA